MQTSIFLKKHLSNSCYIYYFFNICIAAAAEVGNCSFPRTLKRDDLCNTSLTSGRMARYCFAISRSSLPSLLSSLDSTYHFRVISSVYPPVSLALREFDTRKPKTAMPVRYKPKKLEPMYGFSIT